jgi:hypothetical protein
MNEITLQISTCFNDMASILSCKLHTAAATTLTTGIKGVFPVFAC